MEKEEEGEADEVGEARERRGINLSLDPSACGVGRELDGM
jgi:hypothetical protein